MKRPLVVITAGFVLGEVLALCLQEAVYRKCFWFAGALFLAALIARHFLGREDVYKRQNLTHEEFFRQMEEGADITTSQPSPGEVTDFWDKLLKEYDEILYIPMSSGLSGSCQTAIMLSDDYEDVYKRQGC